MKWSISHWLPTLTLLLAGLFNVDPSLAQGFMVKPMRMEVGTRAGQTIEIPLEIRNTAGEEPRLIDLRLVELSQAPSGTWRVVEPSEDTSKLASARAWTSLSERTVQIAPLQPAKLTVSVTPPANAIGYFFAGIVAETPVPDDQTGIVVRVRFLIPLIVQIQGRSVRQRITLDDVVMTYLKEEGGTPTTTAHLRVSNQGQTYSRVRGKIFIDRQSEDRWRPVTRFDVGELSIIPGVTLELGKDLARRLPSGTYRLRGELFVDGRQIAPLEKEIVFEGDPNVDAIAYDTALILEPDLVEMDFTPGATRTTVVRIENPGTDPVKVQMVSGTPRGLSGVEMGDLRGSDLSAQPWTDIRPAEFEIKPGRWQNVRVISRVPREGAEHPNYYADLILHGTYADGQSAGETRSTVHLVNTGIESTTRAVVEQLSLAESDQPARFVVQMRVTNVGNVHLEPVTRALLLTAQGSLVTNQALSGEEGALLPLGKRTYSAELDFSGVEPGYYTLRGMVTLGMESEATKEQVLLVETQEVTGQDGSTASVPRVTVVDPATVELPEGNELDLGSGPVVNPEGDAGAVE